MAPGAGAGADEAAEPVRWRRALVLILAPLLLLGPGILAGKRFLPHLPVANDPLAAEDPAAAALAHERANLVLGDRVFPFLTEQLVMAEELGGGSLPTWSPELGLGLPLFALLWHRKRD